VRKTAIVLFLLILAPVNSDAKDFWGRLDERIGWNKEEVILEAGVLTLHGIDWLQTLKISRNPDRYYEKINRLMGKYPSKGRINTVMGITAVMKVVAVHLLPRDHRFSIFGKRVRIKPRRIVQCTFIGISGYNVGRNYSIGLKFGF